MYDVTLSAIYTRLDEEAQPYRGPRMYIGPGEPLMLCIHLGGCSLLANTTFSDAHSMLWLR